MAWLTGWNYRRPITVSNTGSALTDYQILVTVDTATLVTAGKLLSSCNDIRFTSSDGSTLLNYWIESGPNTSSTKIWVNIPSISSGSNTIYLYYNNPSATSVSNYFNTFSVLGNGSSGSLTVSSANTVVNNYTYLTASASSGNTTITVNSGTAFSNGDDILIIQMKDVSGSSAGNYEFKKISSGGGTTSLTLSTPLKNGYTSVTQIVRIPQYTSVTVNSGASITASAWDGNKGGIVAFRASGTVNVVGSIVVNDKGYLNGETYKGNTMYGGGGGGAGGGYWGGNILGSGTGGSIGGISGSPGGYTTGGNGGNGGGINAGLGGIGGTTPGSGCGGGGGGGGGGGNYYGLGGLGGGQGGGGSCAASSGGGINGGTTGGTNGNGGNGGGGYGTNGTGGTGSFGPTGNNPGSNGNITNGGNGGHGAQIPSDFQGGGGGGGTAGLSYGSADLSTIFLGTSGGNVLVNTGAGGIIIIFANTITVSGTISSNGSDANGQIGGSSGGSIYLTANGVTIGSSLVLATGGTGISAYGGGGAGGSGRIRVSANSTSGTSSPSAYTTGFDSVHNSKYASPEPTLSAPGTEETQTCGTPSANLIVLEIVSNQLLRQYPSYIDMEAISKLLDSYNR